NMVDVFARKGARFRGVARLVRRGEPEFERLVPRWAEHWPDLVDRFNGFVLITVESTRPLTSPAYDIGATERELREQHLARQTAIQRTPLDGGSPPHACAGIMGGGVTGWSVACHLAKLGWADVVLLARKQLTSGIPPISTPVRRPTGIPAGRRRNGSITVALAGEREESPRDASLAAGKARQRRRRCGRVTIRVPRGSGGKPADA